MNKRVTLALSTIIALIGVSMVAFSGSTKSPATLARTSTEACPRVEKPVIAYRDDQFSPACITVTRGTTITWRNESNRTVEVGANDHPSHSGNKELSDDKFVMNVPAGGEATSTVTSPGEHPYHDHISPGAEGMVIVE